MFCAFIYLSKWGVNRFLFSWLRVYQVDKKVCRLYVYQKESKVGENIGEDDSMPIITMSETEIKFFINGYYAYKHLWKPVINEQFSAAVEPCNVVEKCRFV